MNALEDELQATARVCRESGLGIEVTAFAFPRGLDDGFEDRVRRHSAAVAGIDIVSCHGPFLDLYPASSDPEVVALCRRRHEQALNAAAAIGAAVYVAHLSFVPLIRNRSYHERFVEATVAFWVTLADRARAAGITIALENLWEPDPEIQRSVVDAANHPAIKASFDNGHALVFSDIPAQRWIEVLGPRLAHCHLHDNNGEYDEHKPVGQGREQWPDLFDALGRWASQALLVLESDRLDANCTSLARARILASAV